MTPSRDSILEQAMKLDADDRAIIAHEIWNSLHDPADPEIEAAWAEEVERRIAAYDRGEIEAIDADVVFRQMQQKLSQ